MKNVDRSSSSASGLWNPFQRTMLQWNELHPYNAVHVARVPQMLDRARLQAVINATLAAEGLTNLIVEPVGYRYLGGAMECPLHFLDDLADAGPAGLQPEIEHQLNTRFDFKPPLNPFRLFVAPAGARFWLGLTYFHPVADAESVVGLLQRLVRSYQHDSGAPPEKLELYPPAAKPLAQHPLASLKKLATLPRLVRDLRRSCRPPYRDPDDLSNGFEFFSIAPPGLETLLARSKAWQVTLNDIFMALLLQALSPLAGPRMQRGKRTQLSIGCIVNTRPDSGLTGEKVFGVFLGSFVLTAGRSDTVPLEELARSVAEKTHAIKRDKLYLGMMELLVGRWLVPLFSTERRKKLYQKHYPLWGGITNMNLNKLWPGLEGAPGLDYFRAVSTGPVTPFVLSVTTVRQTIHVGMTYRRTVFEAREVQQVRQRFQETIETLPRS